MVAVPDLGKAAVMADGGGVPHRLERLVAWVSVADDGSEGLMASFDPRTRLVIPLIASNRTREAQLDGLAAEVMRLTGSGGYKVRFVRVEEGGA
jgi:hypothetical protein